VAQVGVNRPVLYAATVLEAGAMGLGTAAFTVLLLRITQKRFSATQYALFSSIFALNRTVAGPPAGALIDALGWRDFFLLTIPVAIPGLLMLQRFVPLTARDVPELGDDEATAELQASVGRPLTLTALVSRGLLAAVCATGFFSLCMATLGALRGMDHGKKPFALGPALTALFHPAKAIDWLDVVGLAVGGLVVGVAWARTSPPGTGWGAEKERVESGHTRCPRAREDQRPQSYSAKGHHVSGQSRRGAARDHTGQEPKRRAAASAPPTPGRRACRSVLAPTRARIGIIARLHLSNG